MLQDILVLGYSLARMIEPARHLPVLRWPAPNGENLVEKTVEGRQMDLTGKVSTPKDVVFDT